MLRSYTVIGRNNLTVYHIQAYTEGQARLKFKEQVGQTAMQVIKEG